MSEKSYKRQGLCLYSVLALGQCTGSHRLLNFKNFHEHIRVGLILDLLGSAISTFLILVLNNSMLSAAETEAGYSLKYTSLQSNTVIIKFVLMLLLLVECVVFAVEMCLLNRLKRKTPYENSITKLDEPSKRKKYAKLYSIGTLIWLLVCAILFTLFMVFLDEASCRAGLVAHWDKVCLYCNDLNCADCSETGVDSCGVCKAGYYLDRETGACLSDDC